jgi:hypothetical protein
VAATSSITLKMKCELFGSWDSGTRDCRIMRRAPICLIVKCQRLQSVDNVAAWLIFVLGGGIKRYLLASLAWKLNQLSHVTDVAVRQYLASPVAIDVPRYSSRYRLR